MPDTEERRKLDALRTERPGWPGADRWRLALDRGMELIDPAPRMEWESDTTWYMRTYLEIWANSVRFGLIDEAQLRKSLAGLLAGDE